MPIEKKLTTEQALRVIRDRVNLDLTKQAVAKAEQAIADYWTRTQEQRMQLGPNVTLLRADVEVLVSTILGVLDASDGTITF